MNLVSFALAASGALLLAPAVSGCTTKSCNLVLWQHEIEMTREVSTTAPVPNHRIEACVGTTCKTATPASDGTMKFGELGSAAPLDGKVETTSPNRVRVTVRFLVNEGGERAPTSLRLRVATIGGQPLADEAGEVRWREADDCRSAPETTKI